MFRSKRHSSKSHTTKQAEPTRNPAPTSPAVSASGVQITGRPPYLRGWSSSSPPSSSGDFVGTKQINQNEANVGESRNGRSHPREAGFTVDKKGENVEEQSEMVLIQSKTLTASDPGVPGRARGHREDVRSFPQVHEPAFAADRRPTPS